MTTLQQHISHLVHDILDRYPGSWMTWCDPRGDWGPLLQRVAERDGSQGFTLVSISEQTAGEIGSPASRCALQERIDTKESFVLHITTTSDNLGWLWTQALLSECIYDHSLREQLLAWGWRPQSVKTGDDEVAALARQYLKQDPAEWGGGGLQPNPTLLLSVLVGGATPNTDDRMVLDMTIEQAGLPSFEEQNVARWRTYALVWLLVTQAYQIAPDVVGEGHAYLITAEKRGVALNLLDRWLDSLSLSKGLHEAILEADRIAGLGNDMTNATIKHGPFLSHAAERAIYANTCASLAQQSGRELLEALTLRTDDLQRHAQGFWSYKDASSHPHSLPWGELARLGTSVQMLLDASPLKDWANPDEAITWYAKNGWRVDKVGEELLRNLDKPTPELLTIITPLRQAYRARWEDYMIKWSEIWTACGCPVPDLHNAGAWVAELLKESKRATAMIVADALRYDLGMTLAAQLNKREGAERAIVSAARTALPTITALGMGMALPLPEHELQADLVDGKWQLRQAGHKLNLSIAEQRREWLKSYGKVSADALLSMSDVQHGNVPTPQTKRNRLVVFDDLIDKLGHDEELEAMGSDTVMQRYLSAIEHLCDKGWLRVLIVTDHGFIHWPDSGERSVSPPFPNPVYSSRRALAYPKDTKLKGPQGLAPGEKWRIAVPSGAASFRAYGGLGYFHGGASLQEWIIPCIKIEWPLKAHPVNVRIQPVEQILSLRPKIMLEIERDEMFIEDIIPRQVELRLLDAQQKTILFRSDPTTITPDQEEVAITLRPREDAQAERGTPLIIEVRDARTEELLATEHTTLMVPLENW
jgi:PglZ domain